ncbi:hypothetical protein [Azospirillum argentinense]|nr:hypothetical protein [Azospirillum argentinense]EZQ06543.1 hypothetical protein ABAZ39_21545 [Azospirillum argentinense]
MTHKRMGAPLPPEVLIAQAGGTLAEVNHAVSRGICEAFGMPVPVPWAELDKPQKDAAIKDAIALMRDPDAEPSPDLYLEDRVLFGAQKALAAVLTK